MSRRTSTRPSRVRFNLPLHRQNTTYSDTSTSSHIPNVSEEEVDIQDEDTIASWLMGDGAPRPRRMHASAFEDPSRPPIRIGTTPGPLPLQLLYGSLENLNLLPADEIPPPVTPRSRPQTSSKLKKMPGQSRTDFVHPDGTPISFHFSNAWFNNDEQEYIIPPVSLPVQQAELRILVTKDWSAKKLAKHPENELLIYRVPREHQLYFGMTVREHGLCGLAVRKPEDDDDGIRVLRHGHPSWDTGYKDEVWYVIGKDRHVVSYIVTRIKDVQPAFWTKVKRFVWKNTVDRISLIPPSIPGLFS